MTLIDNYLAALYTVKPNVGDINPPFEAKFEGYERIQFNTISYKNIEPVLFPKCIMEYRHMVKFICALDFLGKVVAVDRITLQ